MAQTSTYGAAIRFAIALVTALALGSLFVGATAHADSWMSSSSQSWGHGNDNDNHNGNNNSGWNSNGGWNTNNHNGNNTGWNNGGWHSTNNWGNSWNHNNHDWWRWHRVGSQWQQYFDWTLYCQWAAQTYGYVSAQCAPYVYSGYNSMGY